MSVILLLLGIGALAAYHAANRAEEVSAAELPSRDPLLGLDPTPSRRATVKYFWVVTALIVVQVLLGMHAALAQLVAAARGRLRSFG